MKQDYTRSDRRIFVASSTVVVILALAAGILSYSALKTLAVMSGINPILALLFPLVIDGLILSGTLLVLFFAVRGKRTIFGIFLTLLGVVASIAGNVAVSDDNLTHQIVHGAPALVLFLSLEALTILLRTRFKEREEVKSPAKEEELAHAPIENSGDFPSVEEKAFNEVESPSQIPPVMPQTAQKASEEDRMPQMDDDAQKGFEALTMDSVVSEREDRPAAPAFTSPATPPKQIETQSELQRGKKKPTPKSQPAPTPQEDDGVDYKIVEGTKREQIESLVNQNPDIRPKTVTEILGGDRSYNSKILREVKATV